jgi:LacI family transcriptional regulator
MAQKKATTIKDVADLAKVSISTVSHVLNETRHVDKLTSERIVAAVEKLGYRPNQLARGLRGAGSKTIGLIISDIREEFFSALAKSIESAANERGYMLMLCDSEEDRVLEERSIEILSDRGVDGIILAPVDRKAFPKLPRGRQLPMVQVDRSWAGAELDFFGIDNAACGLQAVRHFASLGRRRLGFVGHEPSIATMRDRAAGFAKGMKELGNPELGTALTIKSRGGDSKERIGAWLSSNPALEGIVCGNANICYAVLDALEDHGRSVPEEIGILSFDDPNCFRFMRSPITAFRQPTERLGAAAVEALLARVRDPKGPPPARELMDAQLIVRKSCGAGRERS